MRDHTVMDSARAAWVYGIGATLLLFTAALGLNSWPLQDIAVAVWHVSGKDLFVAFSGYAFIPALLFWGGRPSRIAQWAVLLSWPVISALLWRAFDSDLHFSWLDSAGFSAMELLEYAMAIPAAAMLAMRLLRTAP